MLTSLQIENYAIIESLDINFEPSLNTITGQTGAGKSILLGALGLLSGAKADASALLDNQKNCVVEGTFDISRYEMQDYFAANDVDYSDSITIRRVIAPTGKHRAFVDAQPVTQTFLKELSERLIDIHSQHQSLLLAHQDFQLKILDSVASQLEVVASHRRGFALWKAKNKELAKLKADALENEKRKEFLEHHVEEILSLKLQPGEMTALEDELRVLTHAADIAESVGAAHAMGDDAESGYLMLLHRSLGQLSSVKKYYAPLEELYERLNSTYIELKDLGGEFYDIVEKMEVNPARKEKIESRLDTINALFHKHGKSSEAELLELKEQLDEELWQMTVGENSIEALVAEIAKIEKSLNDLSARITNGRQKAIPQIEKHTTEIVKSLGIKDAVFTISINPCEMGASGSDVVCFLFSANAISAPQPIEKVASGGEISRLMLALKGIVSKSVSLPTVIFDEIDTGVSGAIADKMGDIISTMGKTMQVINITHLPQVASKGDHHFFVYKDSNSGTHIKKLDVAEREERIAEMLSGANITDAARTQARELLSRS